MTIRLATMADAPRLRPLVDAAAGELERKFGTPRVAAHWECIAYGINAHEAVVVAEQDGEIVGWCAWVGLPETAAGYAHGLGTWVHEPFRNERVATDMRKFAAEHCRARGLKAVMGTVAVDNAAGLQSSQKLGFRVTGYTIELDLSEGGR